MTRADNGGDNLEDEDIDAPAAEELKMLASLLWEANQRRRLKGKKGEAIRELSEIRAQIADESLSPAERVRFAKRTYKGRRSHGEDRGAPAQFRLTWLPRFRGQRCLGSDKRVEALRCRSGGRQTRCRKSLLPGKI